MSDKQGPASQASAGHAPPRFAEARGRARFDYTDHNGIVVFGRAPWEFRTRWSKGSGDMIYAYRPDREPAHIFGVSKGERPVTAARLAAMAAPADASSSDVREVREGDALLYQRAAGQLWLVVRVLDVQARGYGDADDSATVDYAIAEDGSFNLADGTDLGEDGVLWEGYEGGNSSQAPTAKGFLRIDHDNPAVRKAQEALGQLADEVSGSNTLQLAREERDAIAAEIKFYAGMLHLSVVRLAQVQVAIGEQSALHYLSGKFKDHLAGALVAKALDLLLAALK